MERPVGTAPENSDEAATKETSVEAKRGIERREKGEMNERGAKDGG